MKNPGFKVRLVRLLFLGSMAVAVTAMAESPEGGAHKSARAKPQIIYHLPQAFNYAATLHSQAKSQNNELPVDSGMPTSLQTSNTNANNAARQQSTPPPVVQERQVTPRSKANHSSGHPHSYSRPQSHGNPHGNKSHKK